MNPGKKTINVGKGIMNLGENFIESLLGSYCPTFRRRRLAAELRRLRSARTGGAVANCIEVAGLSRELIGVRDSKNPAGPVLGFRPAEWDAFVGHARNDAFGRP
jgi:hypothetical protein